MVQLSSTAALFFLTWEILITLDEEVEHIWLKPHSAWIKWAYLFARYFALASQITTRVIEISITKNLPLSYRAVKNWHICRVLIAHLVMAAGELVLVTRVYAMYNRARWVLVFFVSLFIAETAVVVVGIFRSVPRQFQLQDALMTIPLSFAYFAVSVIVSQLSIIILSAVKYFRMPVNRREPLVKLLIRDGILAFICVSLLSFLLLIYATIHADWATTQYTWFVSLTSTTACRLILNMQALPATESRGQYTSTSPTLQFTSIFRRTYGSAFTDSYELETFSRSNYERQPS